MTENKYQRGKYLQMHKATHEQYMTLQSELTGKKDIEIRNKMI